MRSQPELLDRVYRFSLAILTFYKTLPKTAEAQVPGVQLYKAATSSWCNYRATQRGRSRKDFISKLGVVVEESDEALGWLEFMRDGQIATDDRLLDESNQLTAIFTACLATARRNAKKERSTMHGVGSP